MKGPMSRYPRVRGHQVRHAHCPDCDTLWTFTEDQNPTTHRCSDGELRRVPDGAHRPLASLRDLWDQLVGRQ